MHYVELTLAKNLCNVFIRAECIHSFAQHEKPKGSPVTLVGLDYRITHQAEPLHVIESPKEILRQLNAHVTQSNAYYHGSLFDKVS